jgi:Flp pilus assembly protein TadD
MAGEAGGTADHAFVVKFLFVCGIRLLHLFAAPYRGPATQENPLKNFSLILTLSALLAVTGTAGSAPATANESGAGAADGLPKVALSEELMYKFLSAELANQRGEHFAAYATMLSIARSSGDPRLARRALEFALSGSLAAEALKAGQLWHELAPKSEEASQALLGLQLANGRYDEARQVLAQQLAAATPATLPIAIAGVQRQLARVQDRARAIAMLRELLDPYRDSLDARLTLAQIAMISGDRATALREARDALARFPGSELAALTLAQIIENKAEAAKSLADFLQKNPKAREARLAYARMLFEQGKAADAKKEFQALLQQYPKDQTTLYALGLLSVQTGDLKDAETYLSGYIKSLDGKPDRERDSSQALMVLAQIAEDRNDDATALQWLALVDNNNQGNAFAALLKRAQLTAKTGKMDAARAMLSQADVDSDDERIKLVIAEAQLLRDAGRVPEALKLIEDALDAHKDNTDLLYEHAMLAERLKQFDTMERSLRQIMKVAPDNQHAYNALGYSFADRNVRLQEAYDLIKKANELAPEDAFIMDSLGWVEFRLGRFEKAEATLRRAYGMKPDPEIAAHLGEVLWARGREEEAKQLWRNANAKDPKNETLKGTLRRLQVKL